jgi:hypothetical protein
MCLRRKQDATHWASLSSWADRNFTRTSPFLFPFSFPNHDESQTDAGSCKSWRVPCKRRIGPILPRLAPTCFANTTVIVCAKRPSIAPKNDRCNPFIDIGDRFERPSFCCFFFRFFYSRANIDTTVDALSQRLTWERCRVPYRRDHWRPARHLPLHTFAPIPISQLFDSYCGF